MSPKARFDPYELFAALDLERVAYVVIGGFARVVHGSAEVTDGLDIAPSLREDNLRRLGRALETLGSGESAPGGLLDTGEPTTARTRAGELRIVPEPWGTRGYDELRRRASRENLGRGVRPSIASVVDCVRMLDASERSEDHERLLRMRRMLELERRLVPRRGLTLER
jgi:hypothetical protein